MAAARSRRSLKLIHTLVVQSTCGLNGAGARVQARFDWTFESFWGTKSTALQAIADVDEHAALRMLRLDVGVSVAEASAAFASAADVRVWMLKPIDGAYGIDAVVLVARGHSEAERAASLAADALAYMRARADGVRHIGARRYSGWLAQEYVGEPALTRRGGKKYQVRAYALVTRVVYDVHKWRNRAYLLRSGDIGVASSAFM